LNTLGFATIFENCLRPYFQKVEFRVVDIILWIWSFGCHALFMHELQCPEVQVNLKNIFFYRIFDNYLPHYFSNIRLLIRLSQVRALPGELVYFLRKETPNQLTPGVERSAAGRFAFLAPFSQGFA